MPILPENKARYPKDWPEISKRIRFERAQSRCEFEEDGKRCEARQGEPHPITGSKVVLTVAHLDHTPEHCEDTNLLAGCQRCHNRYDRKQRDINRKRRIQEKSSQLEMGYLIPPHCPSDRPIEEFLSDEDFPASHEVEL